MIVQQCGIGTLAEAMRAGRSILSIPFSHDQPDNAHRVEQLGMARTIYPRRCRVDLVAQELDAPMSGLEGARAASRIGRDGQAEPGAHAACGAIQAVLKTRS